MASEPTSGGWICGICSLLQNVDYELPASEALRCRVCGGRPESCELLRHDIARLRAELTGRTAFGDAPAGAPATSIADPMNAEEAAEFLRLRSVRALYQQVRRGRVKAHRFGRQLRFSRADLVAALGGASGATTRT